MAKQLGTDVKAHRVIAPSRYGYLRTPMPAGDTSPVAEADAHACLLDALGVQDKVVVIGASAGALSAMQFAIEYPERIAALVLLVPVAWAPPTGEKPTVTIGANTFITNVVLKSDFAFWAFMKVAKSEMTSFLGLRTDAPMAGDLRR